MIKNINQNAENEHKLVIKTASIRNGFLKWMSWQVFFLVFFIVLCIFSAYIYDLLTRFIFILTFSSLSVWSSFSLLRKWYIREDLIAIEKESWSLSKNECNSCQPPNPLLIFSLNRLRESLQWYAKGSRNIFPLGDFYSSQLRREIDLYFSCLTESLYRRYWKSKNERQAIIDDYNGPTNEPNKFDYQMLSGWATSLAEHLVKTRRAFGQSSTEISTLKYYFQERNRYFENNEPEIYHMYELTVKDFYDRMEQSARSRKEALFNFLTSTVLLIVGGLVGLLLAGK